MSNRKNQSDIGRPQKTQVTEDILTTTLNGLAERGFEATTIAHVAAKAQTSKQAIYRRWPDKTAMVAAAIRSALEQASPSPPQRSNVAHDLKICLTNTVRAYQETPLGDALRALVPMQDHPELKGILNEAEDARRLVLRQIFIATPFEADMETRIDLLLGLIYFKLQIRGQQISEADIETAIHLVLGLTAPRMPPT
ncbi:TetR/AcrR family transcriptional regulator [Roseibium algae]|uniref:TetR/AcrR family transcriptional regulator n=1 Tax=Roseibium algae TaxID=3123038 RepID=A0ABU8TQQ6_9HYPH